MRSASQEPAHFLASYFFVAWPHPHHGARRFWPPVIPGWTLNYEMFFYATVTLSLLLSARGACPRSRPSWSACRSLAGCPGASGIAGFYTHPILLEFLLRHHARRVVHARLHVDAAPRVAGHAAWRSQCSFRRVARQRRQSRADVGRAAGAARCRRTGIAGAGAGKEATCGFLEAARRRLVFRFTWCSLSSCRRLFIYVAGSAWCGRCRCRCGRQCWSGGLVAVAIARRNRVTYYIAERPMMQFARRWIKRT